MCSYLCEAEGMTVDEALDSFAAVRAPGVKHGVFFAHVFLSLCFTWSGASQPLGSMSVASSSLIGKGS